MRILRRNWAAFGWIALALALAFGLTACGEDEETMGDGNEPTSAAAGVYVVNEGNFQKGNASLTFYDSETGDVSNFVFKEANGRPLGDTANDVVVLGNETWVVVQNSHVIEVIETGTNRSLATIRFPAGSAPNVLVVDASGQKGYVPLLLGNALVRVNLSTRTIEDTVEVGANPNAVALANGKAYVTNSGFGSGTDVSVVDTAGFTVLKTIEVGDNPGAVVASNGKVVVLNGGKPDDWNTADVDESTPGSLVVIDPATDKVTNTIPLDSGAAGQMELGSDGKAYFIVQGNISLFDVETETITPQFIVAQANGASAFYKLSADPATGRVYATDAGDFQTPGTVYIFESDGGFVGSFEADIIPGQSAVVR